jgi:hypothetical protein
MERHKRPRTTALIVIVCALLLAWGTRCTVAAGELRLIVAPRSAILTTDGNVIFDAYLYNDSDKKRSAPAPEAEFDVIWTMRDTNKLRPERSGSHFGIGTDTAKEYVIKARGAVACVLATHFEAEPGDLVDFHISIDMKLKSGEVKSLKSNSVILYRPKEEEGHR